MKSEDIKVMTAKELKNKTGAALKYVSKGGKVLVTMRGKPVALISNPDLQKEKLPEAALRSFDEAWKDIEDTLDQNEPFFTSWREAEDWSRKRERRRLALEML